MCTFTYFLLDATLFVEEYYKAANANRSTLATFYVPVKDTGTDKAVPSIIFNGHEVESGNALQDIFMRQTPRSHADVEAIDCHILNPNYQHPDQVADTRKSKTLMSLLIVVGGIYRASNERGAKDEEFHDTIILVPNPEPAPPRGHRKPGWKEYLIESQTFRLVAGDLAEEPAAKMAI